MATTVAHGLVGISIHCVTISALHRLGPLSIGLKPMLLAAVAANIPDLDMLVSLLLLSDHKLLHGGITHSFVFAGAVALLLWWFIRRRESAVGIAIVGFVLVSSHVIVDWFTGPQWGLYPSHGLAALWPIEDNPIQMPVSLFKGVEHGNLYPGALYTALWELVLLGPVTAVLMLMTYKLKFPGSENRPRARRLMPRVFAGVCADMGKPHQNAPYLRQRPP